MQEQYKPGQVLTGLVDGLASFGAFIKLNDGRIGLCHVSQMAPNFVNHPSEHCTVGDSVQVRVLRDEGEKVALALERNSKPSAPPFEPMIKAFMKESEERQAEARRNRSSRVNTRRKRDV